MPAQLTEDQIAKYTEAFHRFDTDHDGKSVWPLYFFRHWQRCRRGGLSLGDYISTFIVFFMLTPALPSFQVLSTSWSSKQ